MELNKDMIGMRQFIASRNRKNNQETDRKENTKFIFIPNTAKKNHIVVPRDMKQ